MSQSSGSKRLLIVGLVWLVILGTAAIVYRMMFVGKVPLEHIPDPIYPHRVRISLDSFSGYCVLRSDEFRAELGNRNVGLDLEDDNADYNLRLQRLKSGEAPIAVFTIDALIKASHTMGQLPGTIVMVIDETIGADAMVAYKQAVPNVSALNSPNAKVVMTPDSPSEMLARVVVTTHSLPKLPKDCFIEAKGAEDVYAQFQQAQPNEPKAFVLWEPFVSKILQEKPNAHVVLDSSSFKGYIVDVLVVQHTYLSEHPDIVQKIVEAYHRAAHLWRAKPDGMEQLVTADAVKTGTTLTSEQAKRLVKGIWWKNTVENYAHLGIISGSEAGRLQHIDEMIRGITAILLRSQVIDSDPTEGSPNKLYYPNVLRALHDSQFHPSVIAGASQDTIRQQAELGPLSDEQWSKLRQVGEMQVDAIEFARGGYALREVSHPALQQLADTLQRWPQYYLIVRGHVLAGSDPQADRELASSRAQAVADYIIAQGVSQHRVKAVGLPPGSQADAPSVTFFVGQAAY